MWFLFQEMYVLRTMTHNAAMGLIAARDFVDVVVNIRNAEFVGTLGRCLRRSSREICLIQILGNNSR